MFIEKTKKWVEDSAKKIAILLIRHERKTIINKEEIIWGSECTQTDSKTETPQFSVPFK